MSKLLALPALALAACAPAPHRASTVEPWQVRMWQPNPISTGQFESHPAFDRRAGSLYFVRSSPAFSGWRIFMSKCTRGHWAQPARAPFAGDGVEADPFITRDGKSLYFISTRSENGVKQRELDIWHTTRAGPNEPWSTPTRLPEPINSAGAEWFPRPAADGWLYFGSDRPGGFGGTDIYRARQRGGNWQVENLGAEVNGPGDEYEAEISPDGRAMILMADGDLFLLRREGRSWGGRTKLGPEINTAGLEVGPTFSPSGRSFIFARDFGDASLPTGGSGELVVATRGGAEDWPGECR